MDPPGPPKPAPTPKTKRACDVCRIKRVKCIGEYPCEACRASGILCTYYTPPRKRGPQKTRHHPAAGDSSNSWISATASNLPDIKALRSESLMQPWQIGSHRTPWLLPIDRRRLAMGQNTLGIYWGM
ncbi:uncharacterized protein BJ171DRAFT_221342 [Polychytrium aggregatum]|uniref:uncharacterized protein n=1 Tax=Polychytrium aggregatum TaxID=110093 RepID=UPI0022FE915F|nr:uncharacterized protein BJ171DRAFT_221342 [Polychytrium aggregatum]KAI9197476.1 hypothetical protein BJ171DRAFT_221342 [Polychytrium aggregatum]